MTTSEQIAELAVALCKAQAAMKPAIKDATNPAFRSKYADLSAVWDAARGPLTANGITAWQDVTMAERGVSIVTRLVHVSGQWVEFGPLVIPLAKQDAQGVGSATSYGKRYALSAAIGIVAEEDDDGNAATPRVPPAAPVPPAPAATRRKVTAASAEPPAAAPTGPDRVRELCVAKGVSPSKVAEKYSVESVDDLDTTQLAEAIAKLEALKDRAA